MSRKQDYEDDDSDDDLPRPRRRRRTEDSDDEDVSLLDGNSRAYEHLDCGGVTVVSGGDYLHICDPYRICTGTYCCTCQGFVGLDRVVWADTGEIVTKYRSRMRGLTPMPLKVWRMGTGALLGGSVGALMALVVSLLLRLDGKTVATTCIISGLVGAVILHVIGALILGLIWPIDYSRIR